LFVAARLFGRDSSIEPSSLSPMRLLNLPRVSLAVALVVSLSASRADISASRRAVTSLCFARSRSDSVVLKISGFSRAGILVTLLASAFFLASISFFPVSHVSADVRAD